MPEIQPFYSEQEIASLRQSAKAISEEAMGGPMRNGGEQVVFGVPGRSEGWWDNIKPEGNEGYIPMGCVLDGGMTIKYAI